MSGGRKDDLGKPRMELLPPTALLEVATVLTMGAAKYGDWNWFKGMKWSRLLGAANRHLAAFSTREDNDAESGCSHLAHAICCLLFLLTYKQLGLGEDDRPIYEIKK